MFLYLCNTEQPTYSLFKSQDKFEFPLLYIYGQIITSIRKRGMKLLTMSPILTVQLLMFESGYIILLCALLGTRLLIYAVI